MKDGVTYGCFDQIIIGAEDLFVGDEREEFDAIRMLVGLLIHEFCHYGIHPTYNNEYQPFLSNDDRERSEQFVLMRQECHRNAHK